MLASFFRVTCFALVLAAASLASSIAVQSLSAQTPTTTAPAAQTTGRETTAASVASYRETDLMPVDPDVTVGTLPNGLRYYVRENPRPAKRVELRLVVKAGSVLEDPDQLGLAHFLEHMQFEGTRNFPRQGLNGFLASLGIGIGPDANATTSFDETQYILRIPTESPDVLDRALLVLEDWAHGATFDADAIERQRAIVLSEWRQQLGAAERTRDKIRRIQLAGSRYAAQRPIGDPDVLRRATRAQLVRFYDDWYRPDLMAVIVVGDVQREQAVGLIKNHFSGLTNPTPARPRPAFDVPEFAGTHYAVVTDKEMTGAAVSLSNLRPARRQDTVGGYRQIMIDQLLEAMIDSRLAEFGDRENPPFLAASAARRLFDTPRTKDEVLLQAFVPNNGAARGLEALVEEVQRVARHGFTATEFARAKQARMAGYERSVTESPDRESQSRADEYTRNFLQSEALPTIWQELAFHRRFLPDITLDEVNAVAQQWLPQDNRLVIVSAPEAANLTLPTEARLAAAVKTAESRSVTPYVDEGAGEVLMTTPPTPGTIVSEVVRPEAGLVEWTLSNGATVAVKPTTLKEDQILFTAQSLGGTSRASDADLPSARAASFIVGASGLARFSNTALNKMLSGKAVAVTPFVNDVAEGLSGGSSAQDLETLFQLIHLRFTAPRGDPVAFASAATQARNAFANRSASPDVAFREALAVTLGNGHPRHAPDTAATVGRWRLDTALSFYKARFADASRFTFVFVGSFTVAQLRPFVETYIASLPATRAGETLRDLGDTPPPGVLERTVTQGIAPKSQVAIVFTGPMVYDDQHRLALRAVGLLLEGRLFETIRQELGAAYGVEVAQQASKLPRPEYSLRIEWACDPAQMDALVRRVFDEVQFVRNTKLTRNQLERLQVAMLRDFEQDSQDNGYLLGQIARRYQEGDGAGVGAVYALPREILALTAEAIDEAARTYLNLDRYVKVTQVPEGTRRAAPARPAAR